MGVGAYQLGLLQFDNRVEQLMDVSSSLNLFETIVDDMEKRGMTAIYSSIIEAAEMLKRHYSRDSKTDLRILVLTDGQNNTGASPEQALDAANEINATVDAIIVGDSPDTNLQRIVAATEGECYQISSLGEGFELLEAESVVSLKARRGGGTEKPAFKPRPRVELSRVSEKTITQGTAVQRAPVLAPDLASQKVVDIKKINETSVVTTSASMKRILTEIKKAGECPASSGKGIHVFPAPDNLHFWRALIEGPSGSPFAGGVFALNVLLPSDYPLSAPKVTFETPIYHCNVSDSGKICLNVLQEGWNPAHSIMKCLEAIQAMMTSPNTDDALRQWIADLTIAHFRFVNTSTPDSRYFDKGQERTKQHASTTMEEWRQKWSC
jgi:ubiquitin-protein ligase